MQHELANRPQFGLGSFIKKAVKKIAKPIKKIIPKEIRPFVPAVAGMALGPMAGGFLGKLGVASPMLQQGLGRALVDVGAQALTSDRISPLSAGLSGIMGAVSGYQGLGGGKEGMLPIKKPGKFRIGLDKALRSAQKVTDPFGLAGGAGEGSLLSAAKAVNLQGTTKAAEDALDDQRKKAAIAEAQNEASFESDRAARRQAIIDSMLAAGFSLNEAQAAAAEEGYAIGGRVGFDHGGSLGANEEALAEMMMNMESDEFYIDEEGNLRRVPKRRPRMNTTPGMNEDAIAEQMFRIQMNERMGREDGGMMMAMSDPDPMAERSDMLDNLARKYFGKPLSKLSDDEVIELQDLMDDMPLKLSEGGNVPGLPAGRQVDAREGMFIPMGGAKRADDVPAMLSVNEFVLNDDAVAGLGKLMTGNPDPRAGARALYKIQDQLEAMV